MMKAIELSQYIPYPPKKVWEALTTPELIQQWWAKGDIQPKAGHQFTLDMGSFGVQHCLVKWLIKKFYLNMTLQLVYLIQL
ncbi:TPA: SRPBCC domain-containing protein [Acinetobacter nosocomialis]|nr:SRPBCC domain-containing protein [Acinetobacter nosocomialis]